MDRLTDGQKDAVSVINPSSSSRPPVANRSVCEDWLNAGLFVRWHDWEATRQRLIDARPLNNFRIDGRHIRLAKTWFSMSPHWQSAGTGGPFYEFVLNDQADEGICLLIADGESWGPTMANARVTLSGTFFLRRGDARYGYRLLQKMIKDLDGHIERSEPSRVDICLDLPRINVRRFIDAYDADQYVTRARSTPTYKSDCETLYFGKNSSQVRCCIYDKLGEALEKGTLEMMRLRRWEGEMPEHATRVEFRLRRKALKRVGVDQIEDLFRLEGDILEYLTTKWLRFTDAPVDRGNNNQKRAGILPLWQDIHDRFISGVGGLTGEPLAPLPPATKDVEALAKQAVGVTIAAAKAEGESLKDIRAFNSYTLKLMKPWAEARLPLICGEKNL